MLGSIPFSLPLQFASGLADGSIIRIGTLLKDTGTGRILAHVQESGLAQKLFMGSGGIPPFTPVGTALKGIEVASSLAANAQLYQLKGMVENLQLLQYANIGISAAGLGVSVIGFVLINKKLKSLELDISQISAKMDRHFQDLYERHLRQHFSKLYTLFERAEQAAFLPNAPREWLYIEGQLAEESGFFQGEIGHHLTQQSFNQQWFNNMTTALALSNSARIHCLLRADEMPAAHHASSVIAQHYIDLFDPISETQLAHKMTLYAQDTQADEFQTFHNNQQLAGQLVTGLQNMTDCAETKPLLLESLISQEISGPHYLQALNDQAEHPIVLLDHPV
ncbi:hypothetical protein ACLE2W_00580 [Pseudomonas shahriarae]|uniref:hypothetical protein n=1 Tax=Pseudomonas TaxID=286 RepID=UPI0018E8811B|nr:MULTISPECIES: hypothetical protein [Pseudomonas]MBJ2272568.1 hypothetical protein [Pseudomonas haemolytica]MCM8558625.1 hypothetical protein [Pseudomonas shahriarae]